MAIHVPAHPRTTATRLSLVGGAVLAVAAGAFILAGRPREGGGVRGRVGGAPPDRRPPSQPRGRRRPRPDAGRAARPAVGRRDPGIDRVDGARARATRIGRRPRRARRELHLVLRPRQRRVPRLHGRGEPRDEGHPLRADRRGPRVRMAGMDRLGDVRDLGASPSWCGRVRSRRRSARDVDGGRARDRPGPRGRDAGAARVRSRVSGARTGGARHAGEDGTRRRYAPGASFVSAVTRTRVRSWPPTRRRCWDAPWTIRSWWRRPARRSSSTRGTSWNPSTCRSSATRRSWRGSTAIRSTASTMPPPRGGEGSAPFPISGTGTPRDAG